MAHTQYPITNEYNPLPPERLLYVSSASYGKDWISILHSHSFAELFYVVTGEGFFCTESGQHPIQKGSLILINPNVRHTEKSTTPQALTYITLGVELLKFQFHDTNADFYIYDFSPYTGIILPILNTMLDEVKQKKNSYDLICQNYLSILLLKISRITKDEFAITTSRDLPAECEVIKNYIDRHSQEPLTLDMLADISHLNKFYLSHIFSKAYGISPINYLLERRILHSKELLKSSDFSITQIAHLSGFSSPNYFSQSFKKYTGVTPKSYRQKYKIGTSDVAPVH